MQYVWLLCIISLTHGKLAFNDSKNLILSINNIFKIYSACGVGILKLNNAWAGAIISK